MINYKGKATDLNQKEIDALEEESAKLPISLLASTKAAAKDWAGTVGTLTGLGSFLAVLARDDISDLTLPMQIVIAILLLVTLGAVARAIYVAAIAGQGTPRNWSSNALELKQQLLDETRAAGDQIKDSRSFMFPILVLVGLTTLIIWFGPQNPDSNKFRAILEDGSVLCGKAAVNDNGKVTKIGGISIANRIVIEFSAAESCL